MSGREPFFSEYINQQRKITILGHELRLVIVLVRYKANFYDRILYINRPCQCCNLNSENRTTPLTHVSPEWQQSRHSTYVKHQSFNQTACLYITCCKEIQCVWKKKYIRCVDMVHDIRQNSHLVVLLLSLVYVLCFVLCLCGMIINYYIF